MLGKPKEFTNAYFSGIWNSLGFGFPNLSWSVIVPPVTKPNPRDKRGFKVLQFLSYPAAKPIGEFSFKPATLVWVILFFFWIIYGIK